MTTGGPADPTKSKIKTAEPITDAKDKIKNAIQSVIGMVEVDPYRALAREMIEYQAGSNPLKIHDIGEVEEVPWSVVFKMYAQGRGKAFDIADWATHRIVVNYEIQMYGTWKRYHTKYYFDGRKKEVEYIGRSGELDWMVSEKGRGKGMFGTDILESRHSHTSVKATLLRLTTLLRWETCVPQVISRSRQGPTEGRETRASA